MKELADGFRRVSPLTPLVRGFVVLVAVVVASWRETLGGDLTFVAAGMAAVLLIGFVIGAASWWMTKYRIDAAELRVDTGIINRQSRRVRIDRIQGVDIVQPFVARLFRLAEVRVDTAGGDNEAKLAFLPLAEAEGVRRTLLQRRDAARAARAAGAGDDAGGSAGSAEMEPGAAVPDAAPPIEAAQQVLHRVPLGRLVASAVLTGETVAIAIGLVVCLAVGFGFAVPWAVVGIVGPVVGGYALVVFNRVSSNYGFTVSATESGLQVRRGLFDLNVQTLALHRVQGVVISEPWLWRRFGWARLDVSVAGARSSIDSSESSPTTLHPVAPRAEIQWLARTVLGGPDPALVPLRPAPTIARWLAPLQARWLAVGADAALVVSRHGLLTRRHHVAPHRRVQSVRITQNPLQRLLELATVHVDSPPGPVSVRALHRPEIDARSFADYEVATSRWARVAVPDEEGGPLGSDHAEQPDAGLHHRPGP